MTPPDSVPRWSRRQWVLCVLLFSVAQLGFAFWASENRLAEQRPALPQARVTLVPALPGLAKADDAAAFSDPTVLALAHPRSFSRSAWLAIRPFPYRMTNEPRSPQPLSIATEELVDEFAEFVQTNLLSEDGFGAGMPPALSQPRLSTPTVASGTVLKVEGGLRSAPWKSSAPLPQRREPILSESPTVVRILVNAAGLPVSAALISTCGVAEADRNALDFAKTMRFAKPVSAPAGKATNPVQLASGYLTFRWHGVRWIEPGAASAQVQVSKSP